MRRGRVALLAEQDEAGGNRRKLAEEEAAHLIAEGDKRGKALEIKARDDAMKLTLDAEDAIKKRRAEIDREAERLDRRREDLDKRYERMDQRERELGKRQGVLDKQKQQLDKIEQERATALERIAAMTKDEARSELIAAVEKDSRADMARKMREIDEEMKAEADRRARDVIPLPIQRSASDQVTETAVTAVSLPSDAMKGRIIGPKELNDR